MKKLFFLILFLASASLPAETKWTNWTVLEEHVKNHLKWTPSGLKKADLSGSCQMAEVAITDKTEFDKKLADKTYADAAEVLAALKK